MEIKRYLYRAKAWIALLGWLLFGGGAVMFIYKALNNEVGLIIDGIIELSPSNATIFYWTFAVFSSVFTFFMLILLYDFLFGEKKYIIVYEDRISLPAGFRQKKVKEFYYNEIVDMTEINMGRQKFFEIKTTNDKANFGLSLMPNKAAYEELKMTLGSMC
jgi:hypothetical protein